MLNKYELTVFVTRESLSEGIRVHHTEGITLITNYFSSTFALTCFLTKQQCIKD